jgi:hypothetical protein
MASRPRSLRRQKCYLATAKSCLGVHLPLLPIQLLPPTHTHTLPGNVTFVYLCLRPCLSLSMLIRNRNTYWPSRYPQRSC